MRKILIVGSQHGNELLGEKLYQYLEKHPIDGLQVNFYLANPRARKLGVRYTDTDMNRSYGAGKQSYEREQAALLLTHIREGEYDLVLDCHTTTVEQAPCFIVRGTAGAAADFLAACHIENVVIMGHDFVGLSLIGNVENAISIEISASQVGLPMHSRLRADLAAYAQGKRTHATKMAYPVDELLKKTEVADPEVMLENFTLAPEGFYPVLVGEEAYKKQTDYLGFKAHKAYRIKV